MHNYAVLDHDRESIGRWLGSISWAMPPFAAATFASLASSTGWGWIGGLALTSTLTYAVLHWLFKTKIWKIEKLRDILKIPNLNGDWKIEGKTLNEDGSIKNEWFGTCKIEQDWQKILIFLNTESSESFSYIATLSKQAGKDCWKLAYSYTNEPLVGSNHELHLHKGFCEIDFNKALS